MGNSFCMFFFCAQLLFDSCCSTPNLLKLSRRISLSPHPRLLQFYNLVLQTQNLIDFSHSTPKILKLSRGVPPPYFITFTPLFIQTQNTIDCCHSTPKVIKFSRGGGQIVVRRYTPGWELKGVHFY